MAVAGGLGLVGGAFLSLLRALSWRVTLLLRSPSVSLQDSLLGVGDFKENLLTVSLLFVGQTPQLCSQSLF